MCDFKIAAIGDLHLEKTEISRTLFEKVDQRADLLLIAGDISNGKKEDLDKFIQLIKNVNLPIILIFGNHDYDKNNIFKTRKYLESKIQNISILDGECKLFEIKNHKVGIVGTKGHGGGFAPYRGVMRGEKSTKLYMQEELDELKKFKKATEEMNLSNPDIKISLTHYSPFEETIEGEPKQFYLFLGSSLFGDFIEENNFNLALNGHAHHGLIGMKKARKKISACNVVYPLNKEVCYFRFSNGSFKQLD